MGKPETVDDAYLDADKWFKKSRSTYELISGQVRDRLELAIEPQIVHDIQCRAKALEKFSEKARKINDHDENKYSDPINEIEDLAAVRVIVFLREHVKEVCDKIEELYETRDEGEIGPRSSDETRFGYESRHLVIHLDKRTYFGKRQRPARVSCEIQVRTILQHAWAEMEHDIGYKSDQDIPPELRRRFSALAGLLEIADTEFSRIQNDSINLRSRVKKELVADITREVIEEGDSKKKLEESAKSVRVLIAERRYDEAIEKYTAKIDLEPKNTTQYIGRAKAHFLNGATRMAMSDISKAEEIGGPSAVTDRLKALFTSGDTQSLKQEVEGKVGGSHAELLQKANSALESGNGVEAFDAFSELQDEGYSRPFSILGKAMALALEKDTEGCIETLSDLRIIPATPMKVAVVSLFQICHAIDGKASKVSLTKIKEAKSELPDFDLTKSPIRFLQAGLRNGKKATAEIGIIFTCLEGQ